MKGKSFTIFITGLIVVLFGTALIFKNKMLDIIGKNQIKVEDNKLIYNAERQIQLSFNYSENGLDYLFTLLEFGSTGCVMCRQMEPVLEEMRRLEKPKVNVVFLHILKPENLALMKYFGISAVPMQILLDKHGKEFYRHYGVITTEAIENRLAMFDSNLQFQ